MNVYPKFLKTLSFCLEFVHDTFDKLTSFDVHVLLVHSNKKNQAWRANFFFLLDCITYFSRKEQISLKSGSHVPENFCQIKIFPSHVWKNTIIYLLLENENKWILKV